MEKLHIIGGNKLEGEVKTSGAKNGVLPAMAVALLTPGIFTIENVPLLNDIKMMAHLLRIIGARVDYSSDLLQIDSNNCSYFEAPYELVSKMRASIYVLSPLLVRFGKAKVSLPGGCAIGARPIDLHLKALQKMGVEIKIEHGYINACCPKLRGADIFFDKSSVGATITVLMAAVRAEGVTNIVNAAIEPEVTYAIDLLLDMGANIEGKGTTNLKVIGVDKLKPVKTSVLPDRIEAGTFLIAGAVTCGNVMVKQCVPEHLKSLTEKLQDIGCDVLQGDDYIKVNLDKRPKSTDITTKPYPGFPTDLQAQFLALMAIADGTSLIEDTIFPERFHHVPELNRLHADIVLDDNRAIVKGVDKLSSAPIMATDLRASAALVIAGLAAEGVTVVSRIYHLDRGYDIMEKKLQQLGAEIHRSV